MNKPVAWMMVSRENTSAYLTFEKPTRDMKISHEPHELYTHPVKENCCPDCGCHFVGEYPFNYKVKELTQGEIHAVWASGSYYTLDKEGNVDEVRFEEFAKAVIKKAREK